jgi:NADPH:quinone reductase
MKAIWVKEFGGPEVMRLEEVPDLRPGPGQVLVRVKAAGVNPVDAYIRSGTYARKPTLPYTPGMDGAGTVEEVGKKVKGLKPGQRVYVEYPVTGTYAEFCLVDALQAHPLPAKVTFAQGAALGVPYATAHQALFGKAKAQKKETLLVHGASGGVGVAAVQLGKRAGMKVIGTAGSGQGLQLVKEQGADAVLNHKEPGYLDQLMGLTGGKGVDVILEMAAQVNLGKDLSLLSARGRVVVIGSKGPVEINPRDLMGRDGMVFGMSLFNLFPQERAVIHRDLVKGLKEGKLSPVIGQERPLAQAASAHETILKNSAFGKITLVPDFSDSD